MINLRVGCSNTAIQDKGKGNHKKADAGDQPEACVLSERFEKQARGDDYHSKGEDEDRGPLPAAHVVNFF